MGGAIHPFFSFSPSEPGHVKSILFFAALTSPATPPKVSFDFNFLLLAVRRGASLELNKIISLAEQKFRAGARPVQLSQLIGFAAL